MSVGIGATGFLGIAPETTSGTYIAPTKFALLRSESLHHVQDTVWRRPLRGIADVAGAVPGRSRIEGDIVIEVTPDQVPWLAKAMRLGLTKTGAGPYVYTYKAAHGALPTATISITVVRNGVVFGYVGCVISSHTWTIDGDMLICTMSVVGGDEASQSLPTPTYPVAVPFGWGEYTVEIPTATPVFDMDNFTLAVDDGADPQYRLKSGTRGATFVKFGERGVTLTMERDFTSRTDYDAYKALTSQAITITATKSATEKIIWTFPASYKGSYEISGLSGQADLIRASIEYTLAYDNTAGYSYQMVVNTAENVT
jgi:hypothetical protein